MTITDYSNGDDSSDAHYDDNCKSCKTAAFCYNSWNEDFDDDCYNNCAIHTIVLQLVVWIIVTTIVRILQLFCKVTAWNRAGIF